MKLASFSFSVVVTTLMVLAVLALNTLLVQGKEVESVAELRKLRALGYGYNGNGHSFGGDNGRDHPNRYNNTSAENANDAETVSVHFVSRSLSNRSGRGCPSNNDLILPCFVLFSFPLYRRSPPWLLTQLKLKLALTMKTMGCPVDSRLESSPSCCWRLRSWH